MILALIFAVLIIIVDQVSKNLIVASDITETGAVTVIPGILKLVYSENDGMALGIGSESFRWIFVAVTIIVCGVMIYLMTKNDFKHRLYYASAALIIGGGIGNLIDRALNGYVVDFLSLSFFSPICNIADYCITAGTVCLIVFILFYYGRKKNDTNEASEEESQIITEQNNEV